MGPRANEAVIGDAEKANELLRRPIAANGSIPKRLGQRIKKMDGDLGLSQLD